MKPEDIIEASKREERLSRRVVTTAECARALGMTTAFIRGEIQDGRLIARVFKPAGRKHAKYVIEAADFELYMQQHWPKAG